MSTIRKYDYYLINFLFVAVILTECLIPYSALRNVLSTTAYKQVIFINGFKLMFVMGIKTYIEYTAQRDTYNWKILLLNISVVVSIIGLYFLYVY